jgi:hypothetical protein
MVQDSIRDVSTSRAVGARVGRLISAVSIVLSSFGVALAESQSLASEAPLTVEVLKKLTPEAAAARLLGESGSIVSTMTVILNLPKVGWSLPMAPHAGVSFFTRPRASPEPGLCERNEIYVSLVASDGTPLAEAVATTPMKVSSVSAGMSYLVRGDLTAEKSESQKTALDQTCADPSPESFFFEADDSLYAWTAARLADLAVTQARARDPGDVELSCGVTDCNDINESFAKFSTSQILSIYPTCNYLDGRKEARFCYAIMFPDAVEHWRRWVVYVEAGSEPRDSGFKLQKNTFTLIGVPEI